MSNSVKERLLLTLISLALIMLVSMGIYLLLQVQGVRSAALTECIGDTFNLFEFCYRKTNDEIRLSAKDFLKPFIPSVMLIWIFWLFKVEIQIDVASVKKGIVKVIVIVCYLIAAISSFVPLYLVTEKEDASKLYEILWYNLFLMPWLGITWISAPIFYQTLVDKQKIISEFQKLHVLIWIVTASPFVAILYIVVRSSLRN